MTKAKPWEWVVNGQIEWRIDSRKHGPTVFALASYAAAFTGYTPWWSPETWEARDASGALLPWDAMWTDVCRRLRYPHARWVYLNMKPGFKG